MTDAVQGRGFTLVEVTVVVVIVAVLAGMIVPRLVGSLASSQLREAARGLLIATRYARDFAVTHRCCCRVRLIPAERKSVVECQTDPQRRPNEYEPIQGGIFRFSALPEQVRFGRVRIEAAEQRAEEPDCITFRPTGGCEAAVIELTDGRRGYSLLVFPNTGRTRLVQGAVESLPGDREDLDA